jgi:DNA-binding MarR family transcriptional regulator
MAKTEDEKENGLVAETTIRLERLARLMRQAGHAEELVPTQWEALRYLARANRLSRSPGAVATYLGATKGTVSQSLQTLEKKGLLTRQDRKDDVRFVTLGLTDAGVALLKRDPLRSLCATLEAMGGKTKRRLAQGIAELLAQEVSRQKVQAFGTCASCRYFREGGTQAAALCMKDNARLTAMETSLLCIAHVLR